MHPYFLDKNAGAIPMPQALKAKSDAAQPTGVGLPDGPSLFPRHQMLNIALAEAGDGLVVLPADDVAVAFVIDGNTPSGSGKSG